MARRSTVYLGFLCFLSFSLGRSLNKENRWKFLENLFGVDPNDRIDVKRWNQMNDEDLKRMPSIDDFSSEFEAMKWLRWNSRIAERYRQISVHLQWNYHTNLTEENQRAMAEQNLLKLPFHHLANPMAKKFNRSLINSTDDELKRIFHHLAQGATNHKNSTIEKTSKLQADLENLYSTARVCESTNSSKCYSLSPHLERLMQVEKDYDRLLWAWQNWHDASGNAIRPVYLEFIDLLMKNAEENGHGNLAKLWIDDYEMGNETEFEQMLDKLLSEIMPFYEQLHAFVRGRLCEMYRNRFDCNGPIPAHLLGNMWAQQWQDRLDDFLPYPDAPLVNITRILREKRFTIHRMYKTAEKFFTSIGLYPMTPKFWTRSLFVQPKDRQVVCHPSASDFGFHDDFRVKICTAINDDYFYTIHHEMGHVQYYMAYNKHQPYIYRDGANSGFHEAIGDTIGMYAISPSHLIKLSFLNEKDLTPHYEINYLMRMALQKVAFLPFAYAMDKYRFALFRNEIDRKNDLNSFWWKLRIKYGGIRSPTNRSDAVHFDPGAKYHIPANVPYSRYFIAHILQFQFYRALCRLQGDQDQIHLCDIYENKYVGQRFKQMLSMGSSKPWQDVLHRLTGERKLESQAILDFFRPLFRWLRRENLARGYPVGWT